MILSIHIVLVVETHCVLSNHIAIIGGEAITIGGSLLCFLHQFEQDMIWAR